MGWFDQVAAQIANRAPGAAAGASRGMVGAAAPAIAQMARQAPPPQAATAAPVMAGSGSYSPQVQDPWGRSPDDMAYNQPPGPSEGGAAPNTLGGIALKPKEQLGTWGVGTAAPAGGDYGDDQGMAYNGSQVDYNQAPALEPGGTGMAADRGAGQPELQAADRGMPMPAGAVGEAAALPPAGWEPGPPGVKGGTPMNGTAEAPPWMQSLSGAPSATPFTPLTPMTPMDDRSEKGGWNGPLPPSASTSRGSLGMASARPTANFGQPGAPGGAGPTVRMRSPDGEEQDVPGEHRAHYESRGGQVVS